MSLSKQVALEALKDVLDNAAGVGGDWCEQVRVTDVRKQPHLVARLLMKQPAVALYADEKLIEQDLCHDWYELDVYAMVLMAYHGVDFSEGEDSATLRAETIRTALANKQSSDLGLPTLSGLFTYVRGPELLPLIYSEEGHPMPLVRCLVAFHGTFMEVR